MSWVDETKYEPISEYLLFADARIIAVILIIYLTFVYKIGPSFMKNRPAYNLNNFMSFYNLSQVLTCVYLIKRIFDLTSWSIFDFTKIVHYSPNTAQLEAFSDITTKVFLLKIFELTDTVIFVLRKKQNQITYLHVFHHSSTITLCYLILSYTRSNIAFFPIFLNSNVHVLMYSYYFFANICSAETMKKFIYIKKSITIIQMIQFCLILTQAAISWSCCHIPPVIKYYYCIVVSVIFYGFYDFYKKAYLSREGKKKSKINTK